MQQLTNGKPAKRGRSPIICVCVPEETDAKLRALAELKGVTLSEAMREAITSWIKRTTREVQQ